MLTEIEKNIFKNLLNFIEKELVGINLFNPRNCEIAFRNLDLNQTKIYLNKLEKLHFDKKYPELKNKSILSFLTSDYSGGFGLLSFQKNGSGNNLLNSINNLKIQYINYLKNGEQGSTREALLRKHLDFCSKLDLFLSNEGLLD